jgi:hypothetical protein
LKRLICSLISRAASFGLILGVGHACKTPANHESGTRSTINAPTQVGTSDIFRGISTEHYFTSIGQTHCGIKQEGLKNLASLGYHYVAVSQEFFDKYQGKACGKVFEVTVGGACYRSSDMSCLTNHAPIEKIGGGGFGGQRTAKLIVVDLCPECSSLTVDGVKNFHIDILNTVYNRSALNNGSVSPLENLRGFLRTNIQTVKGPGGITFQDNNLYLSQIKATGECLNLAKMTAATKGAMPGDAKYWLPNRYCD